MGVERFTKFGLWPHTHTTANSHIQYLYMYTIVFYIPPTTLHTTPPPQPPTPPHSHPSTRTHIHPHAQTHWRNLRRGASVLLNKLPQELRLIISRELGSDDWELDRLMKPLEKEVQASERADASSMMSQKKPARSPSTAATLLAAGSETNLLFL